VILGSSVLEGARKGSIYENDNGQIEICAGHLRCLRNLRNLVSAQADSKSARVCASPRKYMLWVQWNTDL